MAGDGWRPIHAPGGVPIQQATTIDPVQYTHFQATKPLLCIVWEVYPSDDGKNSTAQRSLARRGSMHTCSVVVVNDGQPCCYYLENVIIPPTQVSGLDDYYEHLPRPSSKQVTSEPLNSRLQNVDPYNLDGDWCVVSFIGGNQDMPFVSAWWANPKNTYDPATSGKGNPDRNGRGRALVQDGRYFRRVNGVEHVVSSRGDVYLSTRLANSELQMGEASSDGRWPRTTDTEDGGSIHVDVKPSQLVEVTWRTQAPGVGVGQGSEPELPQPNPRPTSGSRDTQDTGNTYVLLDRDTVRADTDTIRLKASTIVSISSDDRVNVTAENGIDVSCDSATISVDSTLDLGGSGGSELLDKRWKAVWDEDIRAVTSMPAGSEEQNAAAIEAIQAFLTALHTGLTFTSKTKAV